MATKSSNNSGKSSYSPSKVSPARLEQKSGSANAFGGYEKVKHDNNTFSMRKTGK